MAIAFYRLAPEDPGVYRNFEPPKRAQIQYWYKAAWKALSLGDKGPPKVCPPKLLEKALAAATEETIFFGPPSGEWTLTIQRKAHMR